MRHQERPVHVTLKRYLEDVLPQGSLVFAIKNETTFISDNPGVQAYVLGQRKAEGVKTGFFDLGALLHNGRSFWLEVKAPGEGVLSDPQQGIHEQVADLGHKIGVADCIENARWSLHQAGIKTKETAGQPMFPWAGKLAKRKPSLNMAIPF